MICYCLNSHQDSFLVYTCIQIRGKGCWSSNFKDQTSRCKYNFLFVICQVPSNKRCETLARTFCYVKKADHFNARTRISFEIVAQ